MLRHYDEQTIVNFQDLRNLIQEEFAKLREAEKTKVQKPKPLSIQQVADRYEVSKATVHNWMKQDIIKGFKMGKGRFFYLDELEKNLTKYRYLEVLETKGLIEKRKHLIL